jgi:hypothetical protein
MVQWKNFRTWKRLSGLDKGEIPGAITPTKIIFLILWMRFKVIEIYYLEST